MCGGGYAPPKPARLFPGYAPGGSGFALRIYWAKGRTKGIAQNGNETSTAGQATAAHPAAKPNSFEWRFPKLSAPGA